jgi:hypothetical protein
MAKYNFHVSESHRRRMRDYVRAMPFANEKRCRMLSGGRERREAVRDPSSVAVTTVGEGDGTPIAARRFRGKSPFYFDAW